MPSFAKTLSGTSVSVAYNDDTFTIWYDAERFTRRLRKQLDAIQAQAQDSENMDMREIKRGLAEALCQLAHKWDAEDDHGQMVPFDVDHLAQTSISFMYEAITRIVDDIGTKNPTGKTSNSSVRRSAATSSRKAASRTSLVA